MTEFTNSTPEPQDTPDWQAPSGQTPRDTNPQDDVPNGGAPGGAQDETVASAARALADATAALTRLLGHQMGAVSEDVGRAVTEGLREASRGLDTASESISKAGQKADRRRDRAEETRNQLLEAAARVFAERGYEGASVGDLASAAGYTKGALYSNFGAKEDLFRTLAREELSEGRVVPRRGARPAGELQALLDLEILAAVARSRTMRRYLGEDVVSAVRKAATTTPGVQPSTDEMDAAVARLAVGVVGRLLEAADDSFAGVTQRLLDAADGY
ncbi:TetR/AcrR family transcriptional regulator [Actinotalea sp. M2MS4P-6]|uniref:TetR/AcrR family transcriptional regulator n=1 Tax=Actinotalea sp. M2MS4P-6 TaxID=2983762 RepID=UPI0021E450D8|nr:TetR/AcrR family transcriptional regulator [Actinotalea sp. M2MS4P-6]MCV2393720.1 TetR/AcrR family transcriptional regulator [Actinotalea sp. M2MS4P-6]